MRYRCLWMLLGLGALPVPALAFPNDPLYLPLQQPLRRIAMPEAWTWMGSHSLNNQVVVAVLDTGIVRGHPDLDPARVLRGYDFISDPALAGDNNGRDDDPTDVGTILPGSSGQHGLHVSGIIAASTNNGKGMAGVAGQARLLPVRVLGVQGGKGKEDDIVDAIRWAAGLPVPNVPPLREQAGVERADVITMGFADSALSYKEQLAVNDAIAAGVIVVAAAGDHEPGGAGEMTEAGQVSPGGLNNVITVGAARDVPAGADGARAPYSNAGARVDLLAPGDYILSTYKDTMPPAEGAPSFSYFQMRGTAQAAAQVSGAVALARALYPLRQQTMGLLLAASADAAYRCDHAPHGGCGSGLLNVAALLKLASSQAECACPGDQICLDGNCITANAHDRQQLDGLTVQAGCAVSGPARGAAPAWLSIVVLLALAGLLRPRRGGHHEV